MYPNQGTANYLIWTLILIQNIQGFEQVQDVNRGTYGFKLKQNQGNDPTAPKKLVLKLKVVNRNIILIIWLFLQGFNLKICNTLLYTLPRE